MLSDRRFRGGEDDPGDDTRRLFGRVAELVGWLACLGAAGYLLWRLWW